MNDSYPYGYAYSVDASGNWGAPVAVNWTVHTANNFVQPQPRGFPPGSQPSWKRGVWA